MEKRRFVKGKKLTNSGGAYRKWAEWTVGDTCVLRFLDSKLDQYKKNSYRCEVLDAEFSDGTGDELVGKNLILNSAGMLDKAMAHVAAGQLFQITYNGTSVMPKGPYAGKSSHTMDVDLLEEEGDSGVVKSAPPVETEDEHDDGDDLFG